MVLLDWKYVMLMILQGSWPVIWCIISQYWRIITPKNIRLSVLYYVATSAKTCAVYGTISYVKKMKCASQFIQCYQLESYSGGPNALKNIGS